ncbi:hypothetical protein TSAR_013120 [Trichomalopsis sarcophagae]|uniref:Uncharacterized protein n=1 Tax=Trichomalopsis sarcophagae TaxID=543379 RepID=A0A232ESP7_9HYME|nr:hypothetical protein TSAR_013120 [Trichomalopsis sarcophagae]
MPNQVKKLTNAGLPEEILSGRQNHNGEPVLEENGQRNPKENVHNHSNAEKDALNQSNAEENEHNQPDVDNEPIPEENYSMNNFTSAKKKIVRPDAWRILQTEKPNVFLREIIMKLWTARKLANRALDLKKVHINIPNRSPVKRIQLNLLRLLISIFNHFLNVKEDIRVRKIKKYYKIYGHKEILF